MRKLLYCVTHALTWRYTNGETMNDEFMSVWDEYVAFRNSKLEGLHFYDQRSKFILALYARINSLCEETLTLVSNGCYVSPQILMRSTLESYVDLRCLIKDENYVNCIFAAEAEAEHKNLSHYSSENPYYQGTQPVSSSKLEELKIEKSKGLNIYERFKKAECGDLYRTVYNNLCRYTHGNISALASKNFENDKVVISRKISNADLLFILSSTINIALSSSIDVLEYFSAPACEQEHCTRMNEKIKVLCKKFV